MKNVIQLEVPKVLCCTKSTKHFEVVCILQMSKCRTEMALSVLPLDLVFRTTALHSAVSDISFQNKV